MLKTIAMLAFAAVLILGMQGYAYASYTVTGLNTTLTLNTNTSANVTEVLTLSISNSSLNQYQTDRIALNLTLSTWQSLVGPMLVQHIINPTSGVYNFKFLPGPLSRNYKGGTAKLIMSYIVRNVTSVKQTSPRLFVYSFNKNVFNFEHAVSGEVLPSNTTLTIVIPKDAKISTVYPIPDAPISNFTTGYANTTRFSWFDGEPLSKFTFVFMIKQGLSQEVEEFFAGVYKTLGIYSYLIIAIIIAVFIAYAYLKSK